MRPGTTQALIAWALATILSGGTTIAFGQNDDWTSGQAVVNQFLVGQKVVAKYKTPLKEKNRIVDEGLAFRIYTVERAKGKQLRLVAGSVAGWVESDQVVLFDYAVEFYTAEIIRNPIATAPYNHRALIWVEKKEYDFAIADYDDSIRLDPNNATAYNNRGTAWRAKKEYDRALADFNAALRIDPALVFAYSNRGITRNFKQEYAMAIPDFDSAIRLDPRFVNAYFNRGIAHRLMKHLDQALADFNKVIQLDPKSPFGYLNRALVWAAKKDYDKALVDDDKVIELAPKLPIAYCNRGIVWRSKNDYGKALADYEVALQLDPKLSVAENNRAWLWSTCPDPAFRDGKKAVAAAQRACELEGWKTAHSVDTLASAYAEAGDFDKAVEWQEKANKLYKDDDDRKKAEERLALYKDKKPYRE